MCITLNSTLEPLVIDTGWVDIGGTIHYRRVGRTVTVKSYGYTLKPTPTITNIAVLPENVRPSESVYSVGGCGASRQLPMGVEIIATSGNVRIESISAQSYGGFCVTYVI